MTERFQMIGMGRLLVASCLVLAAVASDAAAPMSRFSAAPETVRDNVTGLVWQRTAAANYYTWAGAGSYCASLNLGGYPSGWRLPTVKELQTIVDVRAYNPSIDGTAFPSTPAAYFWSSSPRAYSTSAAWAVHFINGLTSPNGTVGTYRVRCVR